MQLTLNLQLNLSLLCFGLILPFLFSRGDTLQFVLHRGFWVPDFPFSVPDLYGWKWSFDLTTKSFMLFARLVTLFNSISKSGLVDFDRCVRDQFSRTVSCIV